MADILGTSGPDTLTGTPDPDDINGQGGDDTIDGGAGNDTLNGGDDNDTIQGGDDNDLLNGGEGNDSLDGGAGVDQLFGGNGNDTMFAYGGDSADGGAGNDLLTVRDGLGTIYDGGTNTDSLTLDFALAASGVTVSLNLMWAGLTGSIGNATVSSFEAITGTVVGSGLSDSITIGANYTAAVTMNLGGGDDTGIGGNGSDTLTGGDGNDVLTGLDGNDNLTGGIGNDTLTGGIGNDTLTDADGTVSLSGDGGDDIVMLGGLMGGSASGGIGTDHLRFDLATAASGVAISLNFVGSAIGGTFGGVSISGFDTLHTFFNQTTEHNDTITLTADFDRAVTVRLLGGNDTYVGGLGGDYVEGGAGNDALGGGGGTNTLIGGIGNDSYTVENNTTTLVEAAGGGTDTVLASLGWGLADQFENLTLTGLGNIDGYGNGAANVITGNGGSNRIEAGGGDDTINGGGGQDFLYGMAGNDTVNGDGGNDSIEDGEGTNTLNGGGGDDYIVVSGDAVNTVDGGAGANDMLLISKFGRTTGFTIDLTGLWSGGSGSVNGGTVTGIEVLQGFEGTQWADVINFGAGTLADVGINDAGAGDDILTGTDGANYIMGGDGNDTIVSRAGTDDLLGGADNDTITIGINSAGTVDGGTGTDTLGFLPPEPGAFVIDFTLLWSGGIGTVNGVSVTGIEVLQTNLIQSDHFVFGLADSIVIGAGYTGNLIMRLGRGADSASGGSGNDIIDGEQDDDVIHGGAGNDSLSGSYASDYVYGDAGDDNISGDTLDVEYNWGNDHLYGGDGNDTIEGGAYQDWLYGDAGSDLLRGDSLALDPSDHGNDVLDGGAGADTMFGGAGDDWFYVDNAGDTVTEGASEGAVDRIFASVSYTMGAAVYVERLSTTDNAGTAAINLGGNELANLIYGNAGANVIDGKVGADTMVGFGGNDWYYVDNAGDMVNEGAGGGTSDRISASLSYTLGAGVQVEILSTADNLATTAINLSGNELANLIYGNAGANILDGKVGADTMVGFGGDDWYFIDNAGDLVNEGAGGGLNDRISASLSYTLGAGVQVERLSTNDNLATTAINLTGNELANVIYGNAGANVLDGKGGADSLIGFEGNDWYYVDNAADSVSEGAGGGTLDRISASVSYTLGAGVQVEMLSTSDNFATTALNLSGNELVNLIYGNAGANVLDGKAGADTMVGFGGDDWYFIDNAGDLVNEGAGGGINDRISASLSYTLGAGVQVEILSTSDNLATTAINLTGNELVNTIFGNAGANVLDGKAGADSMTGFGGDDRYFVDNVGDLVSEGAGGGTLDRVFASVSYTLGAGVQVEMLTTSDNLASTAINLTGNELANTIFGNAGANVLDGKGGADSLIGLEGADAFRFSSALGAGNIDSVSGFSVADDTIQLDDAVFTGLAAGALAAGAFRTGSAAADADDRIVYNSATGALLFDADGNGAGAAVHFATLAAGLALTEADFLVV